MARKNLSSLTAIGSDSESAPTPPAAPAPTPAPAPAPADAPATQPAVAPHAEPAPAENAPRAAAKRSTATSRDRGVAETANKGVPVHLTEELNERLQAYMARKRWSHQTVLLDAIEATYARLPQLIDEATHANEETVERTPLFDRPARPVHTATGDARVKHTVRMTDSNRKTLDDITENLGAPSRNFLITVAYEAYLPTIEKS
ncbi:hypothetical protein DC31_00240 [Microbacterium sp. CH12i]|uniref:hypothetical protein n=1 Tax=Microbacterium sp. CH12i TaxID=1479651 RepID=UPI00046137B4|nr:hypothetical protein [Microbacterium sp. CH12i]KDA07185.1 hypothetical protein DC31_00240 [Microbacterium sp. CH12i]